MHSHAVTYICMLYMFLDDLIRENQKMDLDLEGNKCTYVEMYHDINDGDIM